ncbi:MAG: alpha/beta hydrolase [Desulfobacteraceae bacterium]|nr:alpha/beta hydrolase [Desulfobacteraceae bacterium]
MIKVQSEFLQINDRSIHVRVFNPESKTSIVCWHGLARNCFDFDPIAQVLAQNYRVVCPDTLGRGLSQWAQSPAYEYHYGAYAETAVAICDHFQMDTLDWIGTSMGGNIGVILAAGPMKGRIRSLVINDVGPEIPPKTLERILEYTTGDQPEFDTFMELNNYLMELYDAMGGRSKEEWFQMTMQSARRTSKGKFTVLFDPQIVQMPDDNTPIPDLWEVFEAVTCPILLLHGSLSDLLTDEIVKKMLAIKPEMQVVDIPDCGHAPGLHKRHHMEPVLKFISEQPCG